MFNERVQIPFVAMTAAQARLADTIDVFYGAADKTSESAMAAHAYKRAVEDLDTGVSREMVSDALVSPLELELTGGRRLPRKHPTARRSWSPSER